MARVRGKRATAKQYVKIQALFHGQPTELLVGLICNGGLAGTEAEIAMASYEGRSPKL